MLFIFLKLLEFMFLKFLGGVFFLIGFMLFGIILLEFMLLFLNFGFMLFGGIFIFFGGVLLFILFFCRIGFWLNWFFF